MPELPEVTTMVRGLRNKTLKKVIIDVWSDSRKIIKKPANFSNFKKQIVGRKIEKIDRKGKVILITLDKNKTLLVHPKMSGHFLFGKWRKTAEGWDPIENGLLGDPMNRFIRLIFYLNNGSMLAFSDLRKFARIELWSTDKLVEANLLNQIGEDALKITLKQFKEVLKSLKKWKIKPLLMNQKKIAGIGNIYSDEILFRARVSPFRTAESLKKHEIERIYRSIGIILQKAIKVSGSSISDFRRIDGDKGSFQKLVKVYGRQGQKCFKCNSVIKTEKIAGRSAHFCPNCQK